MNTLKSSLIVISTAAVLVIASLVVSAAASQTGPIVVSINGLGGMEIHHPADPVIELASTSRR